VQQQLVKAKEAAEEVSRAKSLFLANMSHELRTPLNAIIGYSELLGDATLEEDRQTREDLLKIRSAGLQLLGLINDVLDTSKMEAGEMTAHAGDFEVEQVVRDVVNTIRPLALANRNRIEISGVDDAGTLFTDETKLRQSLLNLMSNACKFTEDGVVSLDMRREQLHGRDSIRIAVKDTGLGIPPDEIGKLFQAFHQVDGSQTRKFGGTGLGLSITKSLCEMLGGDIAVASTPGKGSTFTMRLPVELPGIE
jgi:signal transduction histidine kinase